MEERPGSRDLVENMCDKGVCKVKPLQSHLLHRNVRRGTVSGFLTNGSVDSIPQTYRAGHHIQD